MWAANAEPLAHNQRFKAIGFYEDHQFSFKTNIHDNPLTQMYLWSEISTDSFWCVNSLWCLGYKIWRQAKWSKLGDNNSDSRMVESDKGQFYDLTGYDTGKESPTNAWKKEQLNTAKDSQVILLSSLLRCQNKKLIFTSLISGRSYLWNVFWVEVASKLTLEKQPCIDRMVMTEKNLSLLWYIY